MPPGIREFKRRKKRVKKKGQSIKRTDV